MGPGVRIFGAAPSPYETLCITPVLMFSSYHGRHHVADFTMFAQLSFRPGKDFKFYDVQHLVDSCIVQPDGRVFFPSAPAGQQYKVPPVLVACTDTGPTCFCAANALKYKFKLSFDHFQDNDLCYNLFAFGCDCPVYIHRHADVVPAGKHYIATLRTNSRVVAPLMAQPNKVRVFLMWRFLFCVLHIQNGCYYEHILPPPPFFPR
jgi:hypothetical protein